MAVMNFSDKDLKLMQLRAKVMEIALQSASVNTIKSPMQYCEEFWAWVSAVGQPEEDPAPKKRSKRTKKVG